MKKFIKQLDGHINIFCDEKSGLATLEDEITGIGVSAHSCVSLSDKAGRRNVNRYWKKFDRIIEFDGYLYNIDKFILNPKNDMQVIAANLCMCDACIERRRKEN